MTPDIAAHRAGFEAALDGFDFRACPYNPISNLADEWHKGLAEGEQDAAESDEQTEAAWLALVAA